MRIERIVVRRLRSLRERDDRLTKPGGDIHPAVCLRGLNGSGKTTYLEMLAQLWQWFRRCTKERKFVTPPGTALLAEAELAAARFAGLPGPRSQLWIAWGSSECLRTLGSDLALPYSFQGDRVSWDDQETLDWWDRAFTSAESGMDSPPNVVYIEAENKYVPEPRRGELTTPRPAPAFVPVARYLPSARGPSHLEGLLRTLFLARRDRWDWLASSVSELRPGLELLDRFDEATQRPLFRLATGELLTVDRLSAGERSLLINLCMILRWLGPGGIVLLDEPELHQHISLMRGSLSVMDAVISERFGGQLLVASHAPEVWDYFRPSGALLDLGGPET